jgi:hypothetical protein
MGATSTAHSGPGHFRADLRPALMPFEAPILFPPAKMLGLCECGRNGAFLRCLWLRCSLERRHMPRRIRTLVDCLAQAIQALHQQLQAQQNQ